MGKICKRCGTAAEEEKDGRLKTEYPYYCPGCDENLYCFETAEAPGTDRKAARWRCCQKQDQKIQHREEGKNMSIEKFSEAVLKGVRKKADGVFEVRLSTAVKNNGVKMAGITAAKPGCNVEPTVYLEGYYGEYIDGRMGVNTAAGEVYRQIVGELSNLPDVGKGTDWRWDAVKAQVYPKLVNAGMNSGTLEEMPHRMFLDLAVVCYVRKEWATGENAIGCAFIKNGHMGMWGVDEETLYRTAVANMRLEGEPLFEDMGTVLCEIAGVDPPLFGFGPKDSQMYILTNRHKVFGAAEILDGSVLKKVWERLGDGFIVFPSSVHETVIVPKKEEYVYAELAGIVREINET